MITAKVMLTRWENNEKDALSWMELQGERKPPRVRQYGLRFCFNLPSTGPTNIFTPQADGKSHTPERPPLHIE